MSLSTQAQTKHTNSLSSLLPYDPTTKKNKDLKIGLIEFKLLSKAYANAIAALKNGDLKKFDGLVGENACEIRAIFIAIIASKNLIDIEASEKKISSLENRIETLLTSKELEQLMRKGCSLKDVLESQKFDVSLTDEEFFALESFLLTEVRVPDTLGEGMVSLYKMALTDAKRLKSLGEVSSKFTDHLESHARKLLSTASVEFIRNASLDLKDQTLIKMASEAFTVKHNTCWPCTPMFWTYKTVLAAAQKEGIPVIFHTKFIEKIKDQKDLYTVTDEEYQYYEVEQTKHANQYVRKIPSQENLDKPAFIVQGIADVNFEKPKTKEQWDLEMIAHSATNIILAGAADHRQYPDSKKDTLIDELQDEEFLSFKKLAKDKGFSSENPTTFFIQHVYAMKGKHFPFFKSKNPQDTQKTEDLHIPEPSINNPKSEELASSHY